ncbi:MAG: FAD-dependent oxidoreductase [Planctomycetota bacterium]
MGDHADLSADVVVVGAGASGLPAAIGAARAGAKVVLLEEDPVIGGAPSDYYVCLFYGRPMAGVNAELEHLLKSKYAPTPRANFFLPSAYQRAWREILSAEPNVHVLTGARAVGVRRKKGTETPRVTGVTVEVLPGVTFDVRGEVTIDCTGSGIVSELAGCTIMYGREAKSDFNEGRAPEKADDLVQACTWMYFIQGIPGAKPPDRADWRPRGVHVNVGIPFPDAEREPPPEPVLPGETDPELYLQWGGGPNGFHGYDTRDPVSLAQAHAEAYQFLEPEFERLHENGYTVHLAPRIGVRECRRVAGEHIMTEPEITSEKFPEDTIAVAEYGIDIWPKSKERKERSRPRDREEKEWPWRYGIPYRSLVPRGVDGLLVAGKCMSGTHIAQSSFRVMPIAGSTGQAAGVAAALAASHRQEPRDVDPDEIRKLLRTKEQHLQLSFDEPS